MAINPGFYPTGSLAIRQGPGPKLGKIPYIYKEKARSVRPKNYPNSDMTQTTERSPETTGTDIVQKEADSWYNIGVYLGNHESDDKIEVISNFLLSVQSSRYITTNDITEVIRGWLYSFADIKPKNETPEEIWTCFGKAMSEFLEISKAHSMPETRERCVSNAHSLINLLATMPEAYGRNFVIGVGDN